MARLPPAKLLNSEATVVKRKLQEIKAYLGEGEFTDDPIDMDGGIAACRIEKLRKLLAYLCKSGFEHHVAMTRTYCAAVMEEAVVNYLGWDLYCHF